MTDANPQPVAPQPAAPLTPAEDKQWASFAHLGGILYILPSLIIYLVFKDRGPLVRQEAKEALNFQITVLIAAVATAIVGGIIAGALFFATSGGSAIFANLPVVVWVANVIFSILGFVKVNGGGAYRYPVAIRFIK